MNKCPLCGEEFEGSVFGTSNKEHELDFDCIFCGASAYVLFVSPNKVLTEQDKLNIEAIYEKGEIVL